MPRPASSPVGPNPRPCALRLQKQEHAGKSAAEHAGTIGRASRQQVHRAGAGLALSLRPHTTSIPIDTEPVQREKPRVGKATPQLKCVITLQGVFWPPHAVAASAARRSSGRMAINSPGLLGACAVTVALSGSSLCAVKGIPGWPVSSLRCGPRQPPLHP